MVCKTCSKRLEQNKKSSNELMYHAPLDNVSYCYAVYTIDIRKYQFILKISVQLSAGRTGINKCKKSPNTL